MPSLEQAQTRYEEQTREWRRARGAAQGDARLKAAAARVELYEVLVADGWKPDEMVIQQLDLDRQLLLAELVSETAAC